MVDIKHSYILIAPFLCTCNHVWIKQDMETTVRFNYDLDSGTCFKSLTSVSYFDCFRNFQSSKVSFNVMVYRRQYLLCKLCFVTTKLTIHKKPGITLIHKPITDTSHENLALGKPTEQSSTYFEAGFGSASSSLAADGNRQSYMVQSGRFVCAHTNNEASGEHWWMVDLEKIYPVSKITILNRSDCCSQWLRKLIITVGETDNNMQVCSEYEGPGGLGETVNINCESPLLGQFVRISKSIYQTIVLCEVEVYR